MKKILSMIILLAMLACMTSCDVLFPEEPPVEKDTYTIALDKTTLSMNVYEKAELTATVLDENGEVADMAVTWTTSNSAVEIEGGRIFAKSAGQAIITAKLEDGTSATCQVSITYSGVIPQLRLNVTENSVSMAEGQTYTLTPEVYFGGKLANDEDTAFYYVVSDESVATVEDGVISAHKTGNVTITVYGYWRGLGGTDLVGGEDAYGLIITLNLAVIAA